MTDIFSAQALVAAVFIGTMARRSAAWRRRKTIFRSCHADGPSNYGPAQ